MGKYVVEDEGEPFTVTVKGVDYELPALGNVTFEQIEVLADLDVTGGIDEVKRIFASIDERFASEALPKMGAKALQKMMVAWQEDAGITLGESEPSASSPEENTGAQ